MDSTDTFAATLNAADNISSSDNATDHHQPHDNDASPLTTTDGDNLTLTRTANGVPVTDTHDADDMTDGEEVYPIAILVDELKNDDVQLRLNAIRNLGTIAMALGSQRTRDELLPFLNDSIDDEDEILLAVAEELGRFVNFVGGPEFAHTLLPPLENLSAVEEVLVREKAVESICQVVAVFNDYQIEHYLLPLLNRLTNGEWFTSRTSAAGLFATAYEQSTQARKAELQNLFAQLVQDETPMVRRSAAKVLGSFAKKIDKKDFLSNLMPCLLKLTKDDQDSVRLLTVDSILQTTSLLTPEENKQHLLPTLKALGQDKSWRVRFMVATHFAELCEAFGAPVTRDELVDLFVALIKDSEGEVKIMTISQAPACVKMVDEATVVDKLIPCFKDLVVDTNQHVRAAVATHISALAPILGKDITTEYLLPLFLQLLKDEIHDVRLGIISKLENVNQVIGVERLSLSLLPAIVELAEDKQWRVRLAIIEYIPFLASQLGKDFFDDKLLKLCISWLGDTVFSIRDAATTNLKRLVEIFGCDWAKNTVLPQVMTMAHNDNYLYRMTTLFALSTMAGSLSPEIIKDTILPTVLDMTEDTIPNVRFNVAKSLEVLTPILKHDPITQSLMESKVKPALEKLQSDADMDVRWFADKALLAGLQQFHGLHNIPDPPPPLLPLPPSLLVSTLDPPDPSHDHSFLSTIFPQNAYKEVTDRMHQEGIDMQGIIWSDQPMDRHAYRTQRLNNYDSYVSLKKDKEGLRVETLIKNQVVKKVRQDQLFYNFKFAKIKEPCCVGHFQLRNLLWATSKNTVRYLSNNNTIRQWSPQRGTSKPILALDPIKISSMASKEDLVLVGSFMGQYVLQRGAVQHQGQIADPATTVNHADIIFNNQAALVSGNDRKTRLLDLASLTVTHTFAFAFPINCAAMSPDSRLLCAVGDSTETHLMDTSSGKVVKVLDDHHDFSFACCYSPDGRTLATGNQDKTTRIYDVRHLATPLHVLGANVGAIRSLHFTQDGRRLAMAEAIDYVHIYDTSDYSSCQVIDFFGDIAGIAFTPDDHGLFIASSDDKVGGIFEYQMNQSIVPSFYI